MPGLGTSFGRGGATTFAADLQHSDCVFIMGSNMAECHPVAFRWVMKAKTRTERPCKIVHVDPRFTRTSAMADTYAPLRAGSDIVFLGALIAGPSSDRFGRKIVLTTSVLLFGIFTTIAAWSPSLCAEPLCAEAACC